MALLLTSAQFIFIFVLVFGFVGFLRGWRRELVSMGFTLVAVLFLYIGGAAGLAQFVLVRFPEIIGYITDYAIGARPGTIPNPNPTAVLMTAVGTIIIAAALGYLIGNKVFLASTSKLPADRFLGIIPGMVTGFALITYISHLFASSPQITFGLSTPSPSNLGNYIFFIIVAAIVALVIGLIAARAKKSGGKS